MSLSSTNMDKVCGKMTSLEGTCDRMRTGLYRSLVKLAISFQILLYFASFQEYHYSFFPDFSGEFCKCFQIPHFSPIFVHNQLLDLYQCTA